MLGDAAHPMSPFLGQGAVMAIEDGVVLGRCIGIADSFGEAFARYEKARKERANGVQLASRRRARALQGTDPAGPSSGTDAPGLGLFSYRADQRSEEHTSALQSLMRISYAVFCLKKKTPSTYICLYPLFP